MNIKIYSLTGLVVLGLILSISTTQTVAATFTVDIAADDADAHDSNPGDGICSDAVFSCTLRAAIEEANALAGQDLITFSSGFVDAKIVLSNSEGALPNITEEVHIKAYGIDAYNSSATLLRDAPPQMTIDGSNISNGNGLTFSAAGASGSEVSALGIINFPGRGISILNADDIAINRSYIGIDPIDGSVAANASTGIYATNSNGHRIGKTRHDSGTFFVSLGNVIVNNGASGIYLLSSDNNHINGNLVGISESGTGAMGNSQYGIRVLGNNNQIGDFTGVHVAGNYIAANDSGSMLINGDNNRIYSNSLGLGETGSFIYSEGHGIEVFGELNFIGNNGDASNEIYEHVGSAIKLGELNATAANNNFIINNTLGSAGSVFPMLLSGNGNGIEVANGNTNLIQNNRIINSGVDSGDGHGIEVHGDNTTVMGNQVGYKNYLSGVIDEPNMGRGIWVVGDNSTIGSETDPNIVGGNMLAGIQVSGESTHIEYNHIGVNETYQKVGNSASGLVIFHNGGGLEVNHNVIGDNVGTGFYLIGDVNAQNIHHNYIGVAPNDTNIGNEIGIYLEGVVHAEVWRNHVAFNSLGSGIVVDDNSEGVAMWQNYMYANAGMGIDLGSDGETANDAGDFDEGANRLLNSPVIESVVFNENANPRTLTIGYRVNSDASAADFPMNIDFYWSPYDEVAQGRNFLATDAGYNTPGALKTVTFDFNSSASGGFLTATALEAQDRNTSEMAAKVQFGDLDLIFKDGFDD